MALPGSGRCPQGVWWTRDRPQELALGGVGGNPACVRLRAALLACPAPDQVNFVGVWRCLTHTERLPLP